jgi:hypothetical protein
MRSILAKQAQIHSSNRFLQRQCFYALDMRLSMEKFCLRSAMPAGGQCMENPFTYTIKLIARPQVTERGIFRVIDFQNAVGDQRRFATTSNAHRAVR